MADRFIDTLPTGEDVPQGASREDYYRDPTHINEIDDAISEGARDQISKKLAKWIREKMYGVDVREALARFIEWISVLYDKTKTIVQNVENRQNDLESRWDEAVANITKDTEVIEARHSNTTGLQYTTLGNRLDAIEKDGLKTLKCCEVDYYITLQDDKLRKNFNAETVGKIETIHDHDYGLIIAEINNVKQNRFKFEKVGVI